MKHFIRKQWLFQASEVQFENPGYRIHIVSSVAGVQGVLSCQEKKGTTCYIRTQDKLPENLHIVRFCVLKALQGYKSG